MTNQKRPKEIKLKDSSGAELDYTLTYLPATESYQLQQELMEIMLPVMATGLPALEVMLDKKFDNMTKSDWLEIIETISIQDVAIIFVQSINTKELVVILKALLKAAFYAARPVADIFDSHLAGELKLGVVLALEVARHNGFFEFIAVVRRQAKATDTPSKSLKSEIGKSTG